MSLRDCAHHLAIKNHGTLSWHINRLDKKLDEDKYLKSDFENITKLVDHRIETFDPIEYDRSI